LFGLAGGPLLAGALSDTYGLEFALSVVPLFCLLAAVLYLFASRSYEADLKAAASLAKMENVKAAPQVPQQLATGNAP
jgi:predicted MFS family arabinose efflux permease